MIEDFIVGIPILVLLAFLVRFFILSIVEEVVEKHEEEIRK